MSGIRRLSRRSFLKTAFTAAAGVTIIPRRVLGGPGFTAPSDELTKAIIGVGGMGLGHIGYEGARLLAVCDVDSTHLQTALESSGPGVRGYHDFRDVLARPDIDIVHIATPPHWHALMAIAAVEAGKDVWCEKPLTRTIGEGRRLVESVRRTGRMLRVNTWFRFQDRFYGFGTTVKPLKKALQADLLGRPVRATLNAATGFDWKFYWSGKTYLPPQPVPQDLDYDFWLGPAPFKPYNPHRVHQTFRGYWDYDGGGLGDMGMHYLDPVQDLLGKDGTSPVEIEADAPQQHPDACGRWRRVTMRYADGCEIVLDGENKDVSAPFLEGPKGKIFKGLKSDIPDFSRVVADLPDPDPGITDFSESVRTRRPFALNEENGHRSCTIVNLAKIAVRLGRPLRFDPDLQTFPDDPEAARWIDEPMRSPWSLEGAGR
ncbi:MAG: Gfo/Idh/MocA family oxidoreductase [Candidatus Aminicenantes bacterium]|nr:Gfo/Idh/MocA family oxidoreductase [Candidatus Aminicenantes bacterium]